MGACYRRVDIMSPLSVYFGGEGYTHRSSLGVVAIVKVDRIGNKVECGVIFKEGTCIQQRARMLPARRMELVELDERETRER
jgi:hypothetical protein